MNTTLYKAPSFLRYSKHPVNNPCPTLNRQPLFTDRKGNCKSSKRPGGSRVRFTSYKAGGLYEAIAYCLLPSFALEKKMTELSAEPRPLKPQNLGPRAVLQRDGQGKASCSPVPWPIAERRRLTFNRGALPKNQICRQREAWPFVLTNRFFSCFPSDTGFSESEGKY